MSVRAQTFYQTFKFWRKKHILYVKIVLKTVKQQLTNWHFDSLSVVPAGGMKLKNFNLTQLIIALFSSPSLIKHALHRDFEMFC